VENSSTLTSLADRRGSPLQFPIQSPTSCTRKPDRQITTGLTGISGSLLHLAEYRTYWRVEAWTASAGGTEREWRKLQNQSVCLACEELRGWPQSWIMSLCCWRAAHVTVRSADLFCCQLYHLVA